MKFSKLQATGNDFVLIEAHDERDWSALATSMCPRRFGIGADGLIVVRSSNTADLWMRLFNPDGSEAEACGNGMRCLARYALSRGWADSGELNVETLGGLRKVRAQGKQFQVDMGVPRLKPEEIPVSIEEKLDIISDYLVTIQGTKLRLACISMGNPHAVCFIDGPVAEFPLSRLGPEVEGHRMFPNRVNFEVANVLGKQGGGKAIRIAARVWERGAGETLSCGSGACAVAVAARLQAKAEGDVEVMLPGGMLTVSWDGTGEVMLRGPAELVFDGEWPD